MINNSLNKIQHLLRQQIRFLKTPNINILNRLKFPPHNIKLPLYKLTPEQISKQNLILINIFGINN